MQAVRGQAVQRRTTAAALKQQATAFLAEALPEGWLSQPLLPLRYSPAGKGAAPIRPLAVDGGAEADILIISPRGRCHFLFVKAPADRWWDGGPRNAPAEIITDREAEMSRRLRAAGHKARPIWSGRDLARALKSWGCPLNRQVRFGGGARDMPTVPAAARPPRATLRLGGWRGAANV